MSHNARYVDGKQAVSHSVTVTLHADDLVFTGPSLQHDIRWSYGDVIVNTPPHHKCPAILSTHSAPDARLTIEDDAQYRTIASRLPARSRPGLSLPSRWRHIALYGILAILIVGVIYKSLPSLSESVARNIPPSWEEDLGNYVVRILTSDRQTCDAPEGIEALHALRDTLFADAAEPLTLQVVKSRKKEINAFAAPGGQIILFSALIKEADTPEEVAGVMAHEIGHILHNHPTEGVVRSLSFYLIISAMFGVGSGGDTALVANQLMQMRHSREAEWAADEEAVLILHNAGKGTEGLISFFERVMAIQENASTPEWMNLASTHPRTSERIEYLKNQPSPTPQSPPLLTSQQWKALQDICADISKPETDSP